MAGKAKLPQKRVGVTGNVGGFKTVRLTIHEASVEFGCSAQTLSKQLKMAGIGPGADQRWSIMDICRVRFGDLENERARKVREDADGSALENAVMRRQLVEKERVVNFIMDFAVSIRQHILGADMPKESKEDILRDLSTLFNSHKLTIKMFGKQYAPQIDDEEEDEPEPDEEEVEE